ncbi:butyrophilin-like protein 2 isoform X4 [Microtus oregoni]|uniref:butyrophilin-like protein 2 isoform X4 n=1 Tax=Microtus oregoni TaxID=111838 RepID=UPI001BB212C0|nr:butyrophilin-like protein 2 isoform X4 [Microtus oregoni]
MLGITAILSPVFAPGRMVDYPGYSLPGVAASLLFLLLTVKHPDDFRVVGPALPILAKVGEDALLTCQLLPKRTAAHMEVRWYRSDPDTPVIVHRDGAEVAGLQMEEYRGRVEWTEGSTHEGSVALKIHQIQPGDDGQYWCRFQEGDNWKEASVLLRVAALGSSPNIHMEGPGEGGIQLVCTSQGWFPEPEVYWEATWGEELLSFSQNHVLGEDGLFCVEDTLVVRNDTSETYSCFIYNRGLEEAKEAAIALPEKLQTELASSRVIGPSQPILVRVGENIEITCHLSPEANAQSMEVRWVRSHYYPAVHVHVSGAHSAGEQMAEYRGRTVVMRDAVHEGKLTLRIHDARTSDDGSGGLHPADHPGDPEGWRLAAEMYIRWVVPTAPGAVEGQRRKGCAIVFRGLSSREPGAVPGGDASAGHKRLGGEYDLLHQPPLGRGEGCMVFPLRLQDSSAVDGPARSAAASCHGCRPAEGEETSERPETPQQSATSQE